jgi:hypothetical protein
MFIGSEYAGVFDGNYEQFVYLVRCLLALNMRKLVTYFNRVRTAGNPSDIQTGGSFAINVWSVLDSLYAL